MRLPNDTDIVSQPELPSRLSIHACRLPWLSATLIISVDVVLHSQELLSQSGRTYFELAHAPTGLVYSTVHNTLNGPLNFIPECQLY